ncbi:hypothetical protein COLO4_07985 [Corchorus olitorius]|uniref:Protein kinase domain-containing protein n=1 Tax=Corchorus olitorius TaxID=93759 RepID=A0A1R3KHV2_9ROSI|nr:hypothetical protein COLO4_07985 [Corchorus olitorius]
MRNKHPYSLLSLFGVSDEKKLNKSKFPRSRVKEANESSLLEQLCRRFSLNEILAATFNFDSNLVIGRDGSGTVYKGFMDDGNLVVAVKRLSSFLLSRKEVVEEFRNDVQLLCQLRHQHLVSLIGFCDEEDETILVYNYMTNGSLYDHLHGNNGYDPLSWKQRLEICIGAAWGLHYLHSGAKRAIIHRDIKTKNILLDDQLDSKLSDFGLSKIGPLSMSNAPIKIQLPRSHSSTITSFGGRVGYWDPELFLNATLVTDKSDVYSLAKWRQH